VIRTERLLLRTPQEGDLPAILAYRSDPAVLRYLQRQKPWTQQEVWHYILAARRLMRQESPASCEFGIVLEEEGLLIGECGLAALFPEDTTGPPDAAAVGFILHRDYWGRGYATEAARALLRFAFVDLGLCCVDAGCLEENAASRRVLEKAGMTLQGTQEEFPGSPPGVRSLVFRLDREEWLARNEELDGACAPTNDALQARDPLRDPV
jgi:RimJ/RimL family protein N-acetyltransferase